MPRCVVGRYGWIVLVLATLQSVSIASATTVLLSNLGSLNGSSNSVNPNGTNAIDITSASTQQLLSIVIPMQSFAIGVSPFAAIFADTAGVPGSQLAVLSTSSGTLSSSFQNVTFTGNFVFDAGTKYWLEFKSLGGFAEIATSSAAFAGIATSSQVLVRSGTNVLFSVTTPGSDGLALEVIGTPVPVPAAPLLLLSGLGALAAFVKRSSVNRGRPCAA